MAFGETHSPIWTPTADSDHGRMAGQSDEVRTADKQQEPAMLEESAAERAAETPGSGSKTATQT